MPESNFELIVNCVTKHPGSTGRELATHLRRNGNSQFTSKLVNQTLYRLLTVDMVARDSSSDKPKWFPVNDLVTLKSAKNVPAPEKRPLDTRESKIRTYRIAATEVRVLIDTEASSNDPYLSPDWVGSHVVASVNANHPFWSIRLNSAGDIAMYCMITAIDAYVQWKVARLHEPPDATELQNMRDYALRFCTLVESEDFNSD